MLCREGKKLLVRRGDRWEDNNKTDLMEVCGEDVDWIYVAQDSDR
jgi:hypothetical protein